MGRPNSKRFFTESTTTFIAEGFLFNRKERREHIDVATALRVTYSPLSVVLPSIAFTDVPAFIFNSRFHSRPTTLGQPPCIRKWKLKHKPRRTRH
jgi:hypothetical protein